MANALPSTGFHPETSQRNRNSNRQRVEKNNMFGPRWKCGMSLILWLWGEIDYESSYDMCAHISISTFADCNCAKHWACFKLRSRTRRRLSVWKSLVWLNSCREWYLTLTVRIAFVYLVALVGPVSTPTPPPPPPPPTNATHSVWIKIIDKLHRFRMKWLLNETRLNRPRYLLNNEYRHRAYVYSSYTCHTMCRLLFCALINWCSLNSHREMTQLDCRYVLNIGIFCYWF